MTVSVHDARPCALGEGPLWHPERQQFFWFDILSKRLMTQNGGKPHHWQFDDLVSAAGWASKDELLIASEKELFLFNLETGTSDSICPLEADTPTTRSNDGRADTQGGFWIGTMGKSAERFAGAIYRYYKGELRELFVGTTIPNSICFAPDGSRAYYADTVTGQIMAVDLDHDGWPTGNMDIFLDLRADGLNPDGSVTDAAGNLWNAQWGASRVAQYSPDGVFLQTIGFPAQHTSCPAFGGPDLTTLFCTSARQGIDSETLAAEPLNGQTFALQTNIKGQPEPRVIL